MNPLVRRFLAVGALALAVTTGFAADAFQGKISWSMTSGKNKMQDLNQSIKGAKLRTDINADGQQIASIIDMDKLEMITLMPSEKMYMVMPFKETVEKAVAKSTEKIPDLEVTGRTETILGYSCKELLVKDGKNVTEMWVTDRLGVFMGMNNNMGGGNPFAGKAKANAAKWEEVLKSHGGFPLRVVTRDGKSKETFKMEATKVEPGSLPDSLFQPPAGYKKFEMPNLGNMLKGFGG